MAESNIGLTPNYNSLMPRNDKSFWAKGSSSARFLKGFAKEQKLSESALKEYNLFKEKLILNHGLIQATKMLV
jgi:hypothetical protein